jgi:hypothetical protein
VLHRGTRLFWAWPDQRLRRHVMATEAGPSRLARDRPIERFRKLTEEPLRWGGSEGGAKLRQFGQGQTGEPFHF